MSTSNIPVQLTGIETLTPPERSQAFAVLTSDVLTSYRKPEFFGRFRNAVAASDEYDGRLPATWEQTEFLERGVSDVDPSLLDIGLQDAVHLHQTARRLINAGAMTAVIEAAHVYAYESLDDPDILGSVLAQSRQAALLGGLLRSHGIKVRQMLFIDDYNVDPTSGKLMDILQTDDLVEATSSVGFVPEMILREASMVGLAKKLFV